MIVQIIIFPHFGRDRNRSVHKPNPVQNHKLFSIRAVSYRSNGVRARRVWSHRYSSRLPQPRLANLAVCVCVCVCAVVAEDLRALRFTAGDWVKETWQTVATSSPIGHRRRRQLCTAFVIVQIHVIAQCVSSCMLDLCQWWANLESNINAKSRILYTVASDPYLESPNFTIYWKNKTYIISNIYHRLETANNNRVMTLIRVRMYCFRTKQHGLNSFDSQYCPALRFKICHDKF